MSTWAAAQSPKDREGRPRAGHLAMTRSALRYSCSASATRGPLFLTRALVDLMPPGASVVNVSTQMTRQTNATSLVCSASRAGLESLSGTLAMALGPRGIRVNSVAPGPTATDFNDGAMRDSEALREYISKNTAFGRVGRPDDIGLAVAALVGPEMAWITGQRIEATGGALL